MLTSLAYLHVLLHSTYNAGSMLRKGIGPVDELRYSSSRLKDKSSIPTYAYCGLQ